MSFYTIVCWSPTAWGCLLICLEQANVKRVMIEDLEVVCSYFSLYQWRSIFEKSPYYHCLLRRPRSISSVPGFWFYRVAFSPRSLFVYTVKAFYTDCAGWSVPSLFTYGVKTVYTCSNHSHIITSLLQKYIVLIFRLRHLYLANARFLMIERNS